MIISPEILTKNGNGKKSLEEEILNIVAELKRIIYRPFKREQIKYREGPQGKKLSYVATVDVIDRLNEAFDFQWNWEVFNIQTTESEVCIQGRMTARVAGKKVVKEAFGGKIIRKNSTYSDNLMSASSDGLKKAASLFGIGSHLYREK